MPKKTFNNLSYERQQHVLAICRREFETHCFDAASVSAIVEQLGIARGTFYKYFEDLEDCYFYLLARETKEVHDIFFFLLKQNEFDIVTSLAQYGKRIAREIHDPQKYALYRNRYLGWTPLLQEKWQIYLEKLGKKAMPFADVVVEGYRAELLSGESIHLIKAVVHDLIARNFSENWTKAHFIKNYQRHIQLLTEGLKSNLLRD